MLTHIHIHDTVTLSKKAQTNKTKIKNASATLHTRSFKGSYIGYASGDKREEGTERRGERETEGETESEQVY